MALKKKRKKTVQPGHVSIVQVKPSGIDNGLLTFFRCILSLFTYSLVFIFGGIVAAGIILFVVGLLYVRIIAVNAQMSVPSVLSLATESKTKAPITTGEHKNILILGIDALSNRDESTILTDTIMLASVNIRTGRIATVSYPRDMYIASHSAKINSLYEKGKALSAQQPELVMSKTIEDISGIPVHHVVVLNISTVGEIIDALGGLSIDVERSFVDYRFPRTDVDVRVERDPEKLYEVVAFTQGTEHMSGDRALRYIRSRKSTDPIEGTDDARVRRQQRVIAALISKMKDPMLIRNPEQLGKLLAIYNKNFSTSLPASELTSTLYQMIRQNAQVSFVSYQFPIQENGKEGLLFHPQRHVSGAWVYIPVDPTYSKMQQQIQSWLKE